MSSLAHPDPDPAQQAPRAVPSLDLERIAVAIHLGELKRGRVLPFAYHALTPESPELQSLHGRAAVALNLGDRARLDAALDDATIAIGNQHPHVVRQMDVARAIAATTIATWLASMSTKGDR